MPKKRPQDWGRHPFPRTLEEAIDGLDTEEMGAIYDLFHAQGEDDTPSGSDTRKLFGEYLAGSLEFRAGVDAACIWAIGYRFDSIIAVWYARGDDDFDEGDDWLPLVERWRNA